MKILAVEFSSEQRSVAIVERAGDSFRICGRAEENGGRNAHAFVLIEQALQQAKMGREEIGCIAVGLGPGSYTGIRAAIALAQGWELGREIKVLGISSVQCLAEGAFAKGRRGWVNIIVDALRNEFYLAGFELTEKGVREMEPLHIMTSGEVKRRIAEKQVVTGPDVKRFFLGDENLFPDAATLGNLALEKTDFVPGEQLEPIYLRETSFVKAPPSRVIGD